MISLYHGSNVEINEIDLSICKVGKDFGKGFYLNPNFEQAREIAIRTTRVLQQGQAIVNGFEFNEAVLTSPENLKIKIFPDYSEDWADFVVLNRKNKTELPVHDYDIVVGPIADDTVGVQIRRYIQGYIPAKQLVEELRFHGNHAIQYFFGTQQAIKLLKRI